MGIELLSLIDDKGGDSKSVIESQKSRYASTDVVAEVQDLYKKWVSAQFEAQQRRKTSNATQKEIGMCFKKKEDPEPLKAKKASIDKEAEAFTEEAKKHEAEMRAKVLSIGNLVHSSVPVSDDEENNKIVSQWHPDGPTAQVSGGGPDVMAHFEVMHRLGMIDLERGAKIAGHRGYFLLGEGVDLAHALTQYGLNFLKENKYTKAQPPFFLNRGVMAKTAQLDDFDESLYKLEASAEENEKFLIATSEQPISGMFMDEWFESPAQQLPIRFAGYSTCFRKEAGSSGRDVQGLFRIHHFEKVEQFCITDPESSWEEFDNMCDLSEKFYQSLKLPYRVVAIVSGALNNAAAKKHDLEAWFPFQSAYKELVSVSNCTDYQSRALEVRCGIKKQSDTRKVYVHMLNGTLCAVQRALCCIAENYQTETGLVIPEVLRPYMGGRDFLPYVQERPKPKN